MRRGEILQVDFPGLLGLRLHDLLHTFATRLIHAGVDVFTVQKILGHSTIVLTMTGSVN